MNNKCSKKKIDQNQTGKKYKNPMEKDTDIVGLSDN